MRLDKFLKVSRIIKRRTLSKEISESSRVKVNGKVAKPSTRLKVGDEIVVKALGYDNRGRLNLSRKDALPKDESKKEKKSK